MAKTINRLTARETTTLTTPGLHADGGGLYLRVEATGARRWSFLFQWKGRRAEMGFGPLRAISLARARILAQEAREAVAAGINPIEQRRRQRASQTVRTFGEIADELIERLAPTFKSPVHLQQWRTTLKVDAAALRDKNVSEITTDDVLSVLKPIWQAKTETAVRLRGRIERVLDAAKVLELRDGDNPARWRGHLAHLLPKRTKLSRGHHAALPIDGMPGFMVELRKRFDGQQRPDAIARQALEFTILTAARTGQTVFAHTDQFDMARGIWIIPKEIMKLPYDHRVTLCRRAAAIVSERWPEGGNGHLFPGLKGAAHMSNMAMLKLLQQDLNLPDYTVHGFRSTFKDWATERTNFPDIISEIALAHRAGDETELAYRRSDALEKRRVMMEAWANFCDGTDEQKVVQLFG